MDRLRAQAPSTVLSKLRNLPAEAPKEERAMLRWFLLQGKYPKWRHEVRKLVDAEVNVEGRVDVHAERAHMDSQEFETAEFVGDLNLAEILSVENPEDSYENLKTLKRPTTYRPLPSFEELKNSFTQNQYFLPDESIFTIHQAILTGRSLLVSGPPGVGKTEAAGQIAKAMGLNVKDPHHFNKLFCTPGTDIQEAVYQWNDAKRLLDLQLLNGVIGAFGGRVSNDQIKGLYREIAANAYGLRYLEFRKLLRACVIPYRTVTLIDEADKPYPTFDNELLDILQFYRYDIPEYGPIGRDGEEEEETPFFVLTVNDSTSGGRDLSPMLVSRCTTLFLNYLPATLEQKVIQAKCGLNEDEAGRVAQFFYQIRITSDLKLRHPPSTREVIATGEALKKSGMETTEKNMLRLNCHWVKNRLDHDTLRKKYAVGNDWKQNIS